MLDTKILTKTFPAVLWHGSDHHIGSMGITMNKTMLENHLGKCFTDLDILKVSISNISLVRLLNEYTMATYQVRNINRVNSNCFNAMNISYLLGIHKLHGENSRCAEIPINLRSIDTTSNVRRQPSKVIQTFFAIFGLIQEIQFLKIIAASYSQLQFLIIIIAVPLISAHPKLHKIFKFKVNRLLEKY